MTEWSIRLEYDHVRPGDDLEDRVEQLLEILKPHSPAASYGASSVAVRISIDDRTPDAALAPAIPHVNGAVAAADLTRTMPVHMEIESAEHLQRELEHPSTPELIGVSEIAEILGVSVGAVAAAMHKVRAKCEAVLSTAAPGETK